MHAVGLCKSSDSGFLFARLYLVYREESDDSQLVVLELFDALRCNLVVSHDYGHGL